MSFESRKNSKPVDLSFLSPLINGKQQTLVDLEGDQSPFLRTTSNTDIFTSLPKELAPPAPVEWNNLGNSQSELNSQSNTTFLDDPSSVSHSDNNNWPFVFDQSYRTDSALMESVSLARIENGSSSIHNSAADLFSPEASHSHHLPGVYQYPISPFADHHPGCFTDPNQRPYFEQHYSYHYPYGAPHPPVAVDDNFNFDNSAYNNYPPESHEAYHQRPPFPNQFPAGLPTDSLPPPKSASPKRAKPAAHNSSDTNACRRRTSQHDFYCSKCEVHIGIVFIRGAYSSLCAQPVDLLCTTCSNYVPSEQNDDLAEQKKRKRTDSNSVSTANDKIDCEVCHSVLGHGGLTDHVSEGEIKTEFICTDCGDKYMFCSECGGGGKQRTGKWRPKELFEAGRRTCSLPHIRVGAAEVHYKVIPLNELNSYVLQGIQDVFFDCLLSLYCVPSVMTTDKYRTFEQIKAEIVKLWSESVLDVLTNNVLTGQKYVTVAWIQKRHRNKGTAKPNTSKDAAPWLQKFGLTNVVIPQPKSRNSQEDDQCFVAFSIAEWDIHSQSIFLAQMAPRSVFLKTMEGYIDLIKNCVSQIKSDATALQVAKPAHIWCWAHSDHARLQSIPSRLKFVSTEEYLALHPNVSPEAFERFDYEPLKNEGTTLHASSVKPFSK